MDIICCTSGDHLKIWLLWSLIIQSDQQKSLIRPSWRELIWIWLLHHVPFLVKYLIFLRQNLLNRFLHMMK